MVCSSNLISPILFGMTLVMTPSLLVALFMLWRGGLLKRQQEPSDSETTLRKALKD